MQAVDEQAVDLVERAVNEMGGIPQRFTGAEVVTPAEFRYKSTFHCRIKSALNRHL